MDTLLIRTLSMGPPSICINGVSLYMYVAIVQNIGWNLANFHNVIWNVDQIDMIQKYLK